MTIVDGKTLAEQILDSLRRQKHTNRVLAAILIGKDPASIHFLRQKEKAAQKVRVRFRLVRIPASIGRTQLKRKVSAISRDPKVGGVIIQLPIPSKFGDPAEVINLIPKEKDVDVLGDASVGAFAAGYEAVLPPVVAAIKHILDKYRLNPAGMNVVIIGRGRLVGKPAAIWFMNRRATVSVLNSRTKHPISFTKNADILVTGVSKPGFITGNMVKRGVAVFDAGYAVRHGKPTGDCDFGSVSKKARLITPVPGGIGPLTVAMLLKNFYVLTRSNHR